MADPGRSRRLFRAPWAASSRDEEVRAHLLNRLTALFKWMFWAFVALLTFLKIMYAAYPTYDGHPFGPRLNVWVYVISGAGLAVMAYLWRVELVRGNPTLERLRAIDNIYVIGTNAIIAAAAVLSYDFRPAAYTCLAYSCFAVLPRALLVPDTGRRTAIVTSIGLAPMVLASIVLAYGHHFGLAVHQEIPDTAYVVGYLQLAIVAVLLSAAGSRIIYDLKKQVTEAERLGEYILERKIGEGGMGTVWLGRHLMLRRDTAIKRLRSDRIHATNLERFEREVQILSQLTHPNTVAVYDYGKSPHDGQYYYAMEYLGGGITLHQLVEQDGAQPADRVVAILAQVCGALQEAHDRGIVHRDVKPANIMLCERGGMPDVAKVLDFGLANEITTETGASTQVILGTADYIAPEAVTDPATVGPAADLYALGAVGYYLLAGRRLFEGKTTVDVLMKHASAMPTPPSQLRPGVPVALEAVILRCLAKRPEERFASAAALAQALRKLAREGDWSAAQARAWWAAYRAKAPVVDATAPTESLAIDLAPRGTEAAS